MNNVERFENLMAFKSVDRFPMVEWAHWWDKTIDRWHQEGLPSELTEPEEIRGHLGLDCYYQLQVTPRSETCPGPKSHGAPIISSKKEYTEIKPHLYPENAFDMKALKFWAEKQKAGQAVIWFTMEGFFWYPRTLFGIEGHMYAFFDHPELMQTMNADLLKHHLDMLDKICEICTPNFMTFAEDMSYNHGPMLSKDSFNEFIAPYYKKIIPELKKRGILPIVDSDGDVTELIYWLEEVGVEGLLPLERMAGVDVAQIRTDHPDFRMIGAFDKTIMHLGEEAMRKEFERLLPVIKQGGFIPSVDHQTPPGVSLETYRCYISILKEYCQKACD